MTTLPTRRVTLRDLQANPYEYPNKDPRVHHRAVKFCRYPLFYPSVGQRRFTQVTSRLAILRQRNLRKFHQPRHRRRKPLLRRESSEETAHCPDQLRCCHIVGCSLISSSLCSLRK